LLEIGGDIRVGGVLLAGDFNGDATPDIVWRMWSKGKFVVLLGQGSRTFGSPIEHSSAGEPDVLAAADFNNDGKLDLLSSISIQSASCPAMATAHSNP